MPAAVIDMLAGVQAELNRGFSGVSWAKPAGIHLTLRFLGEVGERQITDIIPALEDAAAGLKGFRVTTGAVGGFPNLKRPRVLWVGIEESPELMGLYSAIEDALAAVGFERESRSWHPHLTLCRIRSADASRVLGALAIKVRHDINMTFGVNSFVLYKSTLSPKGAEYTVIRRFGLGAGAGGDGGGA